MPFKDTEEGKKYNKKWREEHNKEIKEYNKEYQQRPEVKAKKKKYNEDYQNKNKDEIEKRVKEYRQKPEVIKRIKEYRQKPEVKEYFRVDGWKRRGIKNATIEKFNQILEEQNHCCYTCGKHESEFKNNLDLDHKHSTGEIRGILCRRCNMVLGFCGDDIKIFEKMIKYLLLRAEIN